MTTKLDNEVLLNSIFSDFCALVQSEECAADIVYLKLVKMGLTCQCGSVDLARKSGSRKFRCRSCKRSKHFTSGTLLEGVAKLRAWLGTMILLGEGVAVSSNRLAQLFGIAQATAHCMHKKILAVIAEHSLENSQHLISQLFNEIIFRRSRESAPDRHPVNDDWVDVKDDTEDGAAEIVAIGLLSAAGQAVINIIDHIGRYFHGVSRKCLQLYVASFWRFIDRKRWSAEALLKACLNHEPIPYSQLLDLHSTKMVRVSL